jgi:type IV secretory pathway TraG/TraD family ATPase VirD4
MVLKENQEIVFVENLDPIAAEKLVWYKDGELRQLGVNLHPDASAD